MTWVAVGSAAGSIAGGLLSQPGGGGVQKSIGRETARGIGLKNSAFDSLWKSAQGLSDDPTQYTAGFTPDQLAAQQRVRDGVDLGQGDYRDAQSQLKDWNANPITAGKLNDFLNPYTDTVVNNTMSDLDRQRQIALVGNSGASEAAGAYGGSRLGVQNAETNTGALRVMGTESGILRNQGYVNAQGAQQEDFNNRLRSRGVQLTGNGQLTNLITQRRAAYNQDTGSLNASGGDQQAYQQALKDWALKKLNIQNTIESGFSPQSGAGVTSGGSGWAAALGGALEGGRMGGQLGGILGNMFPNSDQRAVAGGMRDLYNNTGSYTPNIPTAPLNIDNGNSTGY